MTQARDLADGKFDTDTLVVSASNDRVGVNNASPDTTMKVNFSSASTAGFGINDTNSGNLGGMLQFYSGSSNGTLRANIMNANNAGVHAALGTGGTVVFGGTSYVAANALDDYEEGTWTVNLYKGGSALAVGSRYGYYTKVGRLLYISFYWYNNSITTTGSSTYTIQGMPFSLPHASSSGWQFIPTGYMTFSGSEVHRWQANASDTLTLYGDSATDNASGQIEFSGAGVFFT